MRAECGDESLHRLIKRKLNDLTVHQRSLPPSGPVSRSAHLASGVRIPEPACLFLTADGSRSAVMEFEGSFSPLVFCLELADIDWIPRAGHGVSLDLVMGPLD